MLKYTAARLKFENINKATEKCVRAVSAKICFFVNKMSQVLRAKQCTVCNNKADTSVNVNITLYGEVSKLTSPMGKSQC